MSAVILYWRVLIAALGFGAFEMASRRREGGSRKRPNQPDARHDRCRYTYRAEVERGGEPADCYPQASYGWVVVVVWGY
jgi:hypothetical protein